MAEINADSGPVPAAPDSFFAKTGGASDNPLGMLPGLIPPKPGSIPTEESGEGKESEGVSKGKAQGTQAAQSQAELFTDQIEKTSDAVLTLGALVAVLNGAIMKIYNQNDLNKLDPSQPQPPQIKITIEVNSSSAETPASVNDLSEKVYGPGQSGEMSQMQYYGEVNNAVANANTQTQELNVEEKKGELNQLGATLAAQVTTKETRDAGKSEKSAEGTTKTEGPNLDPKDYSIALLGMIFVVALVEMGFELAEVNKQIGRVEIELEQVTVTMMVDLTQNVANLEIAKGETQQMQHFVNAIGAGISLGMQVVGMVGMGVSYKGMKNSFDGTGPVDPKTGINAPQNPKIAEANAKHQMMFDGFKTFGMAGSSLSQIIQGLNDGLAAVEVAEDNAAIEITKNQLTLIQQQGFQKAIEAWKQAQDDVASSWDKIQAAIEKIHNAVGALMTAH